MFLIQRKYRPLLGLDITTSTEKLIELAMAGGQYRVEAKRAILLRAVFMALGELIAAPAAEGGATAVGGMTKEKSAGRSSNPSKSPTRK